MRPRCKFVKADGSSCGATAQPSGWCWFHDPDLAQQREEARKRGGRQPKKPPAKIVLPPEVGDLPLETVQDVVHAIGDTANRVRKGELSTGVGQCLSQLFGTLLRALRGENELTLNLKPVSASPPMLTDEVKQEILQRVRARHAQEAQQAATPLIGLKELSPSPNGENIAHAG